MNKLALILIVFCFAGLLVLGSDFSDTVKRLIPAVVQIHGIANPEIIKDTASDDFVTSSNSIISFGSGFFISSNGLIATAYHVVRPIKGDILDTSPYGNYTEIVKLLNFDTNSDTAILKMEIDGAPFLTLANPTNIMAGDDVGFIGFPVGFPIPIVSKGIISAQVSAPLFTTNLCRLTVINAIVNHGNSGGPLFLASSGNVIGIINKKKLADVRREKIEIPTDYHPLMSLGGVDPIRLSVETYNHSIDVIGDTSELGIGFCVSAGYVQMLIKK
ncbi:MAG TPA: serine protease [Candidatus Limnocylindrales bacterium]|nr:serine protease [Candidatus Limnocylindrales bacterium]